jgi:hypothetical protein
MDFDQDLEKTIRKYQTLYVKPQISKEIVNGLMMKSSNNKLSQLFDNYNEVFSERSPHLEDIH